MQDSDSDMHPSAECERMHAQVAGLSEDLLIAKSRIEAKQQQLAHLQSQMGCVRRLIKHNRKRDQV